MVCKRPTLGAISNSCKIKKIFRKTQIWLWRYILLSMHYRRPFWKDVDNAVLPPTNVILWSWKSIIIWMARKGHKNRIATILWRIVAIPFGNNTSINSLVSKQHSFSYFEQYVEVMLKRLRLCNSESMTVVCLFWQLHKIASFLLSLQQMLAYWCTKQRVFMVLVSNYFVRLKSCRVRILNRCEGVIFAARCDIIRAGFVVY